MQFCMVYQIKSNVHLLYSFIHVFIHNSITKYYWQNFAKPLAKEFRKNCWLMHVSGGSKISHRGTWTSQGGPWTPEAATFRKFCMSNERIWTRRGGACRTRPPRSANACVMSLNITTGVVCKWEECCYTIQTGIHHGKVMSYVVLNLNSLSGGSNPGGTASVRPLQVISGRNVTTHNTNKELSSPLLFSVHINTRPLTHGNPILPADQLISNLLARIGNLILAANSHHLNFFDFAK